MAVTAIGAAVVMVYSGVTWGWQKSEPAAQIAAINSASGASAGVPSLPSGNGGGAFADQPQPFTPSGVPGDLQGGGTVIVLDNDVFDLATTRALRRQSATGSNGNGTP